VSVPGSTAPGQRPHVGWAGRWAIVRTFWQTDIVERGKEPELLVTVSFLLGFGAVRLITHSIRNDWLPFFGNVSAGGVHIHHMVPGMLLVLATGYFGLVMGDNRPVRLLSVLFGLGAALVLDEFALWLMLADVYWTPEGRQSIEAVVVATALGIVYLAGLDFLRHLGLLLIGRIRPRRPPPPAPPATNEGSSHQRGSAPQ
jgi:hypothetical protein